MEKFDINEAGFCPVGEGKSEIESYRAYTDYCIEKHKKDPDAHKNSEN